MGVDAVVSDYLGRLEAAAWPLPAERRRELVGDVREHIETALGEAERRDEATARNVVERLGPPEEIVAAEMNGSDASRPTAIAIPAARSPFGVIEILALLFLLVGALALPLVGPMVGLVLVVVSPRWRPRTKVLIFVAGSVLVFLPVLPTIFLGA